MSAEQISEALASAKDLLNEKHGNFYSLKEKSVATALLVQTERLEAMEQNVARLQKMERGSYDASGILQVENNKLKEENSALKRRIEELEQEGK